MLKIRPSYQVLTFEAAVVASWHILLALTSTGRHFTRSDRLHEFLMRMGGNGYWNQVDVWFSRDAASVKAAKKLICLRSQSAVRAKAACDKW